MKRWLVPPVFPEDDIKTRRANLLNSSLIYISTLVPMLFIGDLLGGKSRITSFAAEILAFAFCLVLRSWMYRGKIRLSSIGLIMMGLILITSVVASIGTIRAPTTSIYLLIVITGGFLFELRGMVITTAFCSLLIGGLILAENAGLLPLPDYSVTITQWIAYTVILAWTGSLTFSSLQIILKEITIRKKAEDELRKSHDDLEIRVRERTIELEEKNVKLETEIAEHNQADEKIKEQATFLDNAQEAIGVRDLDDHIIYWNRGAQRLYGWKAEEVLGKNPVEIMFKDKQEPLQSIEAKRIVSEKGEWIGELHHLTKDGREVIVESHWTLIYDIKANPKSILFINTDVTEKKMFEAQLLRTQRMESIGTLAGGIAHDLNNMLTPMMMSLHILKNKLKDEQSQRLLTILEQNSRRSADLIKQVLSFARGVEGERNPLQVRHIITEIEKISKETFPRNIEIRIDLKKDLFTILGDATQLHQVLMNLCVNARDAMPEGGILSITASNFLIDENFVRTHAEAKIGSYIVVSVIDTGVGISPKIFDRIFEPFFTTKEFGKGTGLGLSTALAIVKSHGGFINVQSEVGKGTTFSVYLPAIKTEIQNIDIQQKLELPIGHGELVLVAEDEDSIREVAISTLTEYGYNVLAADDGISAIALYAQNKDRIKVVLMDMMMPVMDGEASIRAIRRIRSDANVIVVSGLAEKDKLAKIESTGAQAVLPKPYTAEKLLKTIHDVIGP